MYNIGGYPVKEFGMNHYAPTDLGENKVSGRLENPRLSSIEEAHVLLSKSCRTGKRLIEGFDVETPQVTIESEQEAVFSEDVSVATTVEGENSKVYIESVPEEQITPEVAPMLVSSEGETKQETRVEAEQETKQQFKLRCQLESFNENGAPAGFNEFEAKYLKPRASVSN
jgi:hypothetical protein